MPYKVQYGTYKTVSESDQGEDRALPRLYVQASLYIHTVLPAVESV